MEITPGAEGALTATLEWDNPSKTYARGGTLEELTAVVLYRDGEEIYRIDNPVIGGHVTYIDELPHRGYYNYRIIGENSMGKGDRYNEGLYIGEGDPVAVRDVVAEAVGSTAVITWKAPTHGKYNSWINTANLRYDIVRQPDGKLVGVDVETTTFTDETIEVFGSYSYEVTAKTTMGSSPVTASATVMAGPAFDIPVTFLFDTRENFNLWSVVDANGNWVTWQCNDGTVAGRPIGANCYYSEDNLAAFDWLISPRVSFKAGQHYKFTFDALSGDKRVPETLAIAWMQNYQNSNDLVRMDSITQFDLYLDGTTNIRVNLPVINDDQERNIGFLYRSHMGNYNLTLNNVKIEEDHEGYIEGIVTNTNGDPVKGATVRAQNGRFSAVTDNKGYYKLNYLPAGTYTVQVICLGYQNKTQSKVAVTELETTKQDITITPLDTYEVKGHVIDIAEDVLSEAEVTITGYTTYTTMTDAEGNFSFPKVFKNNNYSISISKLGYKVYSQVMPVSAEVDLGTISLEDDIKAPKGIKVTQDDNTATVSWRAPVGTPRLYRIDDGGYTTSVGYQSGATLNHVFGVINPVPATVYSVQFLLSTSEPVDEGVVLRLFDLDEDGMPNGNILFETVVSANARGWTSYTMPSPVEAPHGYYTALSYEGFLGIALDGTDGDSENYPFVKGVNCFGLYTTGQYYFLDTQSSAQMRHNFCIRTFADPYYDEDTAPVRNARALFAANGSQSAVAGQPLLMTVTTAPASQDDQLPLSSIKKIVQDRVRYNVYRMKTPDTANENNWTLLSEGQKDCTFIDESWGTVEQGVYRYAVKAVYTGGNLSAPLHTDSIGRNMLTRVKLNITTNTPDDETLGTKVLLGNGRDHFYDILIDEDGKNDIVFEDVWKGNYTLIITLDGFNDVIEQLDLTTDNEYAFTYKLEENRVQPFNLIIEDVEGTLMAEKRLVWNFADYYYESFEDHEDFVINSPGAIGWSYIDGDGGETGGFRDFSWSGMYQPMAYIVYNAKAAVNADGSYSVWDYFAGLRPRTGERHLTSWAAYAVPNDDWFITPRLYFKDTFQYSFWAKSFDSGYPEVIEVRYSTTGKEKDDFTEVLMPPTDIKSGSSSDYLHYQFDVPAEAKYVAIHHVSDQMRILSIDDVEFGYIDAAGARGTQRTPRRSPALDGQYEVYLDGKKVADTDETSYVFAHLTQGHHTAGVLASYTSGKTAMTTIEFDSNLVDGVEYVTLPTQQTTQVYDLQGRRVNRTSQKGVYIVNNGTNTLKSVRK